MPELRRYTALGADSGCLMNPGRVTTLLRWPLKRQIRAMAEGHVVRIEVPPPRARRSDVPELS